MADVDMPDAPTAAPVIKKKGGAAGDGEVKEGKKRFEVKKVGNLPARPWVQPRADRTPVERRRALGVGYRCRQLRHLPKPHYGPL